jgi:hypothetical protein
MVRRMASSCGTFSIYPSSCRIRVESALQCCAVLPDERTPKHLLLPGNTAQHWSADSTRIRQELGYIEKVPHEEAIRRTIAWERTHVPAGPLPYQFDYAAEDAALQSAHKN